MSVLQSNVSMQCPGCTNIFFSLKSLRVHLSEDHNVAQEELEHILNSFQINEGCELRNESDLGAEVCLKESTQEMNDHILSNDESSQAQPSKSPAKNDTPPQRSTGKLLLSFILQTQWYFAWKACSILTHSIF